MKKAGLFLTLIALAAVTFSSCKTPERCPAYGQVETPADSDVV